MISIQNNFNGLMGRDDSAIDVGVVDQYSSVEHACMDINNKYFSQSGMKSTEYDVRTQMPVVVNTALESGYNRTLGGENVVQQKSVYRNSILSDSNFVSPDPFYNVNKNDEEETYFNLPFDGFVDGREAPFSNVKLVRVKGMVDHGKEMVAQIDAEYERAQKAHLHAKEVETTMYRTPDSFQNLKSYLRRYYIHALE